MKAKSQNIYDDDTFFEGYKLRDSSTQKTIRSFRAILYRH